MPTPESSVLAFCAASRNIRAICRSPSGYARPASVGVSSFARTLPASSTMPTAIFVPPMSTAPIISRVPPSLVSSRARSRRCARLAGARFCRERGRGIRFHRDLCAPSSVPSVSILLRLFRQQTTIIFDDEGTQPKRVAIHTGKSRQVLRRKLRRNDVNQELPFSRRRRKLKNQVACVGWQILPNEHDPCAKLPQIACERQILFAHVHSVDPNSEANILGDDFLRPVAEASRAHCGCGIFH